MKKFSIRKITNLFKRKDNNYISNITHINELETNICIASRPNYVWNDNNPYLIDKCTILDTITIKFIEKIDNPSDFFNIYMKIQDIKFIPNIQVILQRTDEYMYTILVTFTTYDVLVNKFALNKDNNYINYIINTCNMYMENVQVYDYTEKSFELIENEHKSFRLDFNTVNERSIEFLGYTWPNKEDAIFNDELLSKFCYAYLSIPNTSIEYFNHLNIRYKKNGGNKDNYIVKINLYDLIVELRNDSSLLAGFIKDTLMKTIYADKRYFSHIIDIIENISDETITDSTYYSNEENENEEDSEFNQEELYNSLVDEIIK